MQELRHKHKLADLLAVSNLPRSVFYYHIRQSTKPDKDLDLKEHINHIYHQHKGRYGYRRITSELNNQLAQKGMVINHKRVQRLMAKLGLKALVRRQRKFNTYKGTMGKDTIQDNILKRDFKADKPNQKWATDITEFKVQDREKDGSVIQRKLYLSPIIDLFNGEIVSYTMKDRPTYELVKEMLNDALSKLSQEKMDDKPIIHSDQGWHYQMHQYQQTLKEQGLTQSMSRKGNCLDNAVIESFFGTLKQEIFYETTTFTSTDELKQVIDEYIHYYNHDRIKSKLKGLSPVKYRNLVQLGLIQPLATT
ncbi:IS3 family transposase [Staphylococcus epidermidis]|nr:IS3 family transposase [Staphylococcus epidermidis]